MNRICLSIPLAFLCAGCLTSTVPSVDQWLVGYMPEAAAPASRAEVPKHGVVRLSQVVVRSPYDKRDFAVLRADGTLAFDAYNRHPDLPAQVLRGAIVDALRDSGRFAQVVGPTSSAAVEGAIEVEVGRCVLDCTAPGTRRARVAVLLRLLDARRQLVAVVTGEGEADAGDGQYAVAFSRAFTVAVTEALGRL